MSEPAVLKIARATADAVTGVLQTFGGETCLFAGLDEKANAEAALEQLRTPLLAIDVSYVGDVTGGNVFAIGEPGTRRLAALMMGADPSTVDDSAELSELEISAVAEAANQMMAAAAAATSQVLGTEVEIGPPRTTTIASHAEATTFPATPYATSALFTVAGEPATLIQLIPHAFVVRMRQALSDLPVDPVDPEPVASGALEDVMLGVPVRLSVEFGGKSLPLGRLVGMSEGSVLVVDEGVDDPVQITVNGRPFAPGRLVVVDGDWAVRLEADPA